MQPGASTPNSLLRAIKLWYLMPALFHSQDGRIKRRQRFVLGKSGDTSILLPWLMVYTRRWDSRQRDADQEASKGAKGRTGVVGVSPRGRSQSCNTKASGEPRLAEKEETWNMLATMFLSEHRAAVFTPTTAAATASAADVENGNAPPCRPDGMYVSDVLFDAIISRNPRPGPGNDGQWFVGLRSIIHTDIGREEFGRGMTALWRRIVVDPVAFPPEFWPLFLPSIFTALGGNYRPFCVGMAWRRLIITGAMRQWRLRLEEVNREVRQFGVTVPGQVEHVGLTPRTLHETGNWIVITECSNAINIVKRTRCLRRWLIACQRSRRWWPSDMAQDQLTFFFIDSGETRTIACCGGVQKGYLIGPAMFCLAL